MDDEYKVEYLVLNDGSCPFEEWINHLADKIARVYVFKRIERIRRGNFGDCKSITSDISEFRIDFGPGYRVYFSMRKLTAIEIICAGTKKTQVRDIRKAKMLWETYKNAY